MRIVNWIGVIVGLGIMGYGLGAVGYNAWVEPLKTTVGWYLQVAGCVVGGGIVAYVSLLLKDYSFKLPAINVERKVQVVKPETETKVLPDKIVLDAKRLADYECLNHLSERLSEAQDGEGVGLCRKLQDRLFELHHGKTPITPLQVVKTVSLPATS